MAETCGQRRLRSDLADGEVESSLGAQVILLFLSCCSSDSIVLISTQEVNCLPRRPQGGWNPLC